MEKFKTAEVLRGKKSQKPGDLSTKIKEAFMAKS